MQFPLQFPSLTIPTGAGPGQQRITINDQQDGKIKVYNSTGNLVDSIGGAQGQIILYDSTGNMVISLASAAGTDERTGLPFQAGITAYTSTTAINLLANDGTWTASNGSKVVVEAATEAGLFFTPHNGPWNAGGIGTGLAGVPSQPSLFLNSPSDLTHAVSSTITLTGSSSASSATDATITGTTVFANGIFSSSNMAFGSVVITPSAINTPTTATVTYGKTLTGSTFVGMTTAVTGVPQNVSTSVGTPSNTSMAVRLTRTDNTTATTVYWMVWGS